MCDADPEISLVELVVNVPSQWAELPSLLDHRVEEAQRKEQLFKVICLLVALEPLQVVDRIAAERTCDVRSQSWISTHKKSTIIKQSFRYTNIAKNTKAKFHFQMNFLNTYNSSYTLPCGGSLVILTPFCSTYTGK